MAKAKASARKPRQEEIIICYVIIIKVIYIPFSLGEKWRRRKKYNSTIEIDLFLFQQDIFVFENMRH